MAIVVAGFLSAGLALLAFSLVQEASYVGGSTLSGPLDLGATVFEPGLQPFSYAEVLWEDPKCGIRFHFLDSLEYQTYAGKDELPAPAITCDDVAAVVDGPVSHIVAVNDRESGANYTLDLRLFSIHRPNAWLVLVALPILFVASSVAIIYFLRGTLISFLEGLSLRKEK